MLLLCLCLCLAIALEFGCSDNALTEFPSCLELKALYPLQGNSVVVPLASYADGRQGFCCIEKHSHGADSATQIRCLPSFIIAGTQKSGSTALTGISTEQVIMM